MSRSKLLTPEYEKVILSDLDTIKDSNVVIKLIAIRATFSHTEMQVAEIFNISRSTLNNWIKRYKDDGLSGLTNKPRGHNPSKLSKVEKAIIKDWILESKDNNKKTVHWTLIRLRKEIELVFHVDISKSALHVILIKMGLSMKKPRPQHHQSDAQLQSDFKKNSGLN